MNNKQEQKNTAEVIAVYPDKLKISVDSLDDFKTVDKQVEKLSIGSYLEVSDNDNCKLIAIIENYLIEMDTNNERKFIIEANPLGTITDDKFIRGGNSLTIPPTAVKIASKTDIEKIYQTSMEEAKKFCFSTLARDTSIKVPIDGNKFFNKHFAIVGSTGSGKSHTIAKILQEVIQAKNSDYDGLNNSHIILFDIHNEYKSALPNARHLGIKNLILPYWLLSGQELEEAFLDTEANDHNQRNVFKEAVIKHRSEACDAEPNENIHYDSPSPFDIQEVRNFVNDKNNEMVKGSGKTWKQGPLHGKLTNFISRLDNKINDTRMEFFLGKEAKSISVTDTLKQFTGYKRTESEKNANITIIDLSGIPFEILSIAVSLISKILFEYSYFYKKQLDVEQKECETPLVLIYEEAHKYVPKSDLARYKASTVAIERIAKEGRKYGVTLGIVSQRPSEISETIFSQCNNFIAMRLTNPDDQSYVKRLLPDTLGNLTSTIPTLQSGEALIIGESVVMPSIVKIDVCNPHPLSNDITYLEIWRRAWHSVYFEKIVNEWEKR